jgi:hypothetical protein
MWRFSRSPSDTQHQQSSFRVPHRRRASVRCRVVALIGLALLLNCLEIPNGQFDHRLRIWQARLHCRKPRPQVHNRGKCQRAWFGHVHGP